MVTASSTKIGFIGLGVMGKSMVKNLMEAGYKLNVYTRTKSKAEELLETGANWHEDAVSLAKASDVIITMVGYPEDVKKVYYGDKGILKNAKKNTYLIDMTTSKPSLAMEIYEDAKKEGLIALDAPVSGGDIGAKNGTLAIMTGGDKDAYHEVAPIFRVLGERISLHGPAGAGQHTKMANQIAIATNMIGVCESILYAKKAGLDAEEVLATISTGAAASFSLSNLGKRMLERDYEPGFYVKHFIKDMEIALESAHNMGMPAPGLELSLKLYKELADMGEADSGTQALIKLLAHQAEITL
ncbi:NAD(P)-dependent oxidoreductase [Oceanobacillus sp. J11TS1]|uniref:NAD(P)-dependent oxidoreductase n=1 Tax=Oceanobacillus sp. J11TS1 TaxID=2807191 RepID=UPI001B1876CD|nr:NAD(P)-dependent oxidoreductase [Oceanobacillus sp. J11TS1]GIO24589.1 putative oxidoreductase YkwC [Oceanobacillus sp. J11TS1]